MNGFNFATSIRLHRQRCQKRCAPAGCRFDLEFALADLHAFSHAVQTITIYDIVRSENFPGIESPAVSRLSGIRLNFNGIYPFYIFWCMWSKTKFHNPTHRREGRLWPTIGQIGHLWMGTKGPPCRRHNLKSACFPGYLLNPIRFVYIILHADVQKKIPLFFKQRTGKCGITLWLQEKSFGIFNAWEFDFSDDVQFERFRLRFIH